MRFSHRNHWRASKGEGREGENEVQTSQPPPNDVESTARPKENGKSAPEAKPISVEETTATEDAPKAAVEAVAPAVVAATSAAAAATAEKPKPQSDCVVCGHLARNFCSSCKHVFYCTRYRFVIFSDDSIFESTVRRPITSPPRDHQRKHWKDHKEECKSLATLPYRVSPGNG